MTKLEFDGLDDIVTDGGRPEGKGTNQLPPEEVGEEGKGEEGVEDGESESKSRMESKLCYVRIRPDLDVPREGREVESGGQLSTVLTRTRAGKTRTRPEET